MPSRTLLGLLALCTLILAGCQAQVQISFEPATIITKTDSNIRVNVTFNVTERVPKGVVRFSLKDTRVARLPVDNETSYQLLGDSGIVEGEFHLTIRGIRLGWTSLLISYETNATHAINETSSILSVTAVRLAVLRDQTTIQLVYRYVLIAFVILIVIGMGCTIDIHVVLKLVKRPVGLAVGWCTQFILMPNLGVAIGQLLLLLVTDLENTVAFAFGILTLACSPGGGSSNVWTLLFDGDLDLSMTMTFVSQLCALFMMPLWLFVYSRLYIDVDTVRIPFDQVAYNLLQLVFPVLLGVFVKAKWPHVAHKIARAIKPFTILFILFVIGFGTYVNFFLFELIGQLPIIIPFAALLPWLGFLFSYVVTRILRLSHKQVVAISLEAGIQNIGIPILVLQFSMPKPDGDLAAIVPLIVVLVTPVPLYFLLGIKRIRERMNRKNGPYNLEPQAEAADDNAPPLEATDKARAEKLKDGGTVNMSEIQLNNSTVNLVGMSKSVN